MIETEEQRRESKAFYKEALTLLDETGVPYMLGGAFSLFQHTGIYRDTKDLDVFCKPADYTTILKYFAEKGFTTQLYDVRWLAKIFKGEYFIDIIFNSVNNICTVDDTWLQRATPGEFVDHKVLFLSPEELIWCKIYVQNRERYDGADINHVVLKKGKDLDWKWLMMRLESHWHLLLGGINNFQFVYPSEFHDIIPRWVFDDLMNRANDQYKLPPPFEKVCRGPMIDNTQYQVDVKDWEYKAYTIKTI
jgi:hypothetical protein